MQAIYFLNVPMVILLFYGHITERKCFFKNKISPNFTLEVQIVWEISEF